MMEPMSEDRPLEAPALTATSAVTGTAATDDHSAITVRDPAPLLHRALAEWGGRSDLWLFGYGSLIWRPEFEHAEERPAVAQGWHRALRLESRVNRGSPELPGLVLALLPGGSARGVAFRIERERVARELEQLWAREMPTGVYDPKWVRCHTHQGSLRALAFTLSRRSPRCAGSIPDAQMLHILQHARGRFGSTLDYVTQTVLALRERGIVDRRLEQVAALARREGLWSDHAAATRQRQRRPAG
jgi:glutathione-specific gamma-glutamylcyclotransferase